MYRGRLCKRGHDDGGGKSDRYEHNGVCRRCKAADGARRYQERKLDPAFATRRRTAAARWRAANLARDAERHREARKNPAVRAKERRVQAAWEARNAKRQLTRRLRKRLLHALRAHGAGKTVRAKQLGVDYAAIIVHLGPCPGDRRLWHIDHIKPLASFDLTDAQQVAAAFAPSNHQWLLAVENQKKGAR